VRPPGDHNIRAAKVRGICGKKEGKTEKTAPGSKNMHISRDGGPGTAARPSFTRPGSPPGPPGGLPAPLSIELFPVGLPA